MTYSNFFGSLLFSLLRMPITQVLGPLKSTAALFIFSPVFFLSLNFIFTLFHNQF